MGEVVKLHCDCGYKTDELYIGCGMNINGWIFMETDEEYDFDEGNPFYKICYCETCNLITTTNVIEHKLIKDKVNCCKKCNNTVFFLNETDYFCPECKSKKIEFIEVGMWD
tara:strand:+ start:130 stop:462 length:333 start_codon:yes stop_codon:yes gene_type:complete